MNAPEKVPTNVYAKLQAARCQLQEISLKKSGHNKFAGYTYFELGDFLPTINQIFSRIGLCGIVSFTATDATLRIIDTDTGNSDAFFTCPMASAQLKGCHDVQNLGASITYLRRYLYVTALEIVEHDALDATTGKGEKQSAKTQSKATLETFDPDEQKFLKEMAMEVLACLPDEVAMFQKYEEIKKTLDTDEQVAWWSFFDSKSRAALKRGKDTELAGQA